MCASQAIVNSAIHVPPHVYCCCAQASTSSINLGTICCGRTYATTFTLHNRTASQHRFRLDRAGSFDRTVRHNSYFTLTFGSCVVQPLVNVLNKCACMWACAGWFEDSSSAEATLKVRYKSAKLAPGLGVVISLYLMATTQGALDGAVGFSFDSGNSVTISIRGHALRELDFIQARDAVARAGSTVGLLPWRCMSASGRRASLDFEDIPEDKEDLSEAAEQAFSGKGQGQGRGRSAGGAAGSAHSSVSGCDRGPGSRPLSQHRRRSGSGRRSARAIRISKLQDTPVDVLARILADVEQVDTWAIAAGHKDVLRVHQAAAAAWRIPFGGTSEAMVPLVLECR